MNNSICSSATFKVKALSIFIRTWMLTYNIVVQQNVVQKSVTECVLVINKLICKVDLFI